MKKDNNQLAFWEGFIEEWLPHAEINGESFGNREEQIKNVLSTYLKEIMTEIFKEKHLSWQEFREHYLSEKLADVFGISQEAIIEVCFSVHEEVKVMREKIENEYISWREFKEKYLNKTEGLAEILGLDRDEIVSNYEDPYPEHDERRYEIDDDYKFVDGVMRCISRCENKKELQDLFRKLVEIKGAKDIFDEIYRVWVFRAYPRGFDGELFFQRTPGYGGERSEPGKGAIIDILLLSESHGRTYIDYTVGEDYADTGCSVVVKIKHNCGMTGEEIVRALRDAADSYEAYFNNCLRPSVSYYVPADKEFQAILVGLHESDPKLHSDLVNGFISLESAMKEAGWLNLRVSMENGIGEALKRSWPKLYEKAARGEISPIEALIKTGWVDPEDVPRFREDSGKTRDADANQESSEDIPF